MTEIDIYHGKLAADLPFYPLVEAAHCLRLAPATVRSWVVGRRYATKFGPASSRPLIAMADPQRSLLSFSNLVELHILSSIRQIHKMQMQAVRRALDFLRTEFRSEHPLLDRQMLTNGESLFIERYDELVNISENGQLGMREILSCYLQRIERDGIGIPIQLFPFTRPSRSEQSPRLIMIDPRVRFGRPCISGTNLPTAIIAGRYTAGDSIEVLAGDYERKTQEIEEAIRYEGRIAA